MSCHSLEIMLSLQKKAGLDFLPPSFLTPVTKAAEPLFTCLASLFFSPMEYARMGPYVIKQSWYYETENSQSLGKCQCHGATLPLKGHSLQFQHILGQVASDKSSVSVQHNTTLLHLSVQH